MPETHIDLPPHYGDGPLRIVKTCNNQACAKDFLIIEIFKPISIRFEGTCPDCKEPVRFAIQADDLRTSPAIDLPSDLNGRNRKAVVCRNSKCGQYFVVIELIKPVTAEFNGKCPECGEMVPFKIEGVAND